MLLPKNIVIEKDAVSALAQILGIMTDHISESGKSAGWDVEHIVDLETRLLMVESDGAITLGIDDAALLLDGMAFTEMMSVEFPWFEMVLWTTDFVTTELRQYWTTDEWNSYVAR